MKMKLWIFSYYLQGLLSQKTDFSSVYRPPPNAAPLWQALGAVYTVLTVTKFTGIRVWSLHFLPLAPLLGFHAQPQQRGCGLSPRFPNQREKSSLHCVEWFFRGQEWGSSVGNSTQALREAQSSRGPWLSTRCVSWSAGQRPSVQLASGAELGIDFQLLDKSLGRKMLGALPVD